MLDVYSGAQALAIIMSERSDDIIVKGFSKQTETEESSSTSTTYRDTKLFSSYNEQTTVATNIEVRCRVVDPALRKKSVVGLDNPSLIVWELIPFSFVANWFIPIGTWLQTMSAPTGFRFESGSRGVRVESYRSAKKTGATMQARHAKITTYANVKNGVKNTFSRTVLNDFPVNPGPPPIQNLEKILSIPHMLTSLALLQTIFK